MVRQAIAELVVLQTGDLQIVAVRKPMCGNRHRPSDLTCGDGPCQKWIDSVVIWHRKHVGGSHVELSLGAALSMAAGREPVRSDRQDQPLGHAAVPDGPVARVVASSHKAISANARGASMGVAVDGWSPVRTMGDRLDRPRRCVYWRHLRARGLSLDDIADRWGDLTIAWTGDHSMTPPRAPTEPLASAIEHPAFEEWMSAANARRRQGRDRRDGSIELLGAGTVRHALARLDALE